jgi:hypothetical protein
MRRSASLLALTLTITLAATSMLVAPVNAWYPSSSQVELGTATWCTNCPEAYAGIEANKGWFDTTEFNAIRYYSSLYGGQLSNPDSDQRIDGYYAMFGLPIAIFNGTHRIAGGTAEIATGVPYRAAIEDLLIEPAYFKITINSFDFSTPTGSIDLDIEVMETVPDISSMVLRIAITENNIDFGGHDHQDVTRDLLPDEPITVSSLGQIQNVNPTFSVDPTWDPSELSIVAFIQDDSDKKVHASASTHPQPDYSFRYYALGERGSVGQIYFLHDFEPFRVYNTGTQTDTYTMTVTTEGAPDWTANLCDETICYGPTVERTVDPGDHVEFFVDLFPMSSGYVKATLTISSANLPDHDRTITYTYVTDDVDVLLVDDDGYADYETYFTDALDFHYISYGLWHRRSCALTSEILSNFPTVIWHTGLADPSFSESDRTALSEYLDSGSGNLFVSGQNVAKEMHDLGGSAEEWLEQYLHATYESANTEDRTLEGIPTDPLSHELDLTVEGGDGADNQQYLNEIAPADGWTAADWTYDGSEVAAVRAATLTYKVVYFAFGFEAIDNMDDRLMVIYLVLDWLASEAGVDDLEPAAQTTLRISPNPARTSAAVRFTLPQAGEVSLTVVGPDGRVVRTLADRRFDGGAHTLSWDRTNERQERVPAGVYYYRLETAAGELTRKAVLLK